MLAGAGAGCYRRTRRAAAPLNHPKDADVVLADWLLNMPCLMWCRTVKWGRNLDTHVVTYEPRVIPFRNLFHALPAPDPVPGLAPWSDAAGTL